MRISESSDIEIIEKVLQGNQSAFAGLVSRYQNYVFTLTNRIVKNREDAEEVAQDVFIKAYKALADFKGNSKFSTWLYTIVYTSSLSFLRKKKIDIYSLDNENILELVINKNADSSANIVEQKSRSAMVSKAIELLNPDDSMVISLFYLAEQNLDEIGKIMGAEPNTIKVRLHRARHKLKEKMETYFMNEVKDLY